MPADRLVIERRFSAPVEDVYDAWTNPDRMIKWFMAGPDWRADVEADAQPGGGFRVVMHTPDDQALESFGTYEQLEPPRRIVFTWNSYAVQETMVTVELEPVDGGTHLTLIHDGLGAVDVIDRHRGGWSKMLDNLAVMAA